MPELSVVIPVYNEKDNLEELYLRLKEAMEGLKKDYEIIFVDDGSTDGSAELLDHIASKPGSKVTVVHFRRNFGQTAALDAGFRQSKGQVIITLDADLQNDPADIPRLLEKLEEGYDIVSGWRRDRKDDFVKRTLPSRVANWLISKVTGIYLHDYGCTLKCYRREVVEHLTLYGELHRFLPALASHIGARVVEVPVTHHPRIHGESKYGLSRVFKVLVDLIVVVFLLKYSTRPFRLFGSGGLISFGLGFLMALYLSVQKLMLGARIGHRPLLLLSVLLMILGIQLASLGILAELLIRIYFENQGRLPYVMSYVVSEGTTTKVNGAS